MIILKNSEAVVRGEGFPLDFNIGEYRKKVLKTLVGECNLDIEQQQRDKICVVCSGALPRGKRKNVDVTLVKCEQ